MSVKSLIQILILILIIAIIGGVYYEYFDTKKNAVEEINLSTIENQKKMEELERTIKDLKLKNNIQKEHYQVNVNIAIDGAEHTKNKSKSKSDKHQKGLKQRATQKKNAHSRIKNHSFSFTDKVTIELIPENKTYHMTDLIKKAKLNNFKIAVYPIDEDLWVDIGQWNEYKNVINKF